MTQQNGVSNFQVNANLQQLPTQEYVPVLKSDLEELTSNAKWAEIWSFCFGLAFSSFLSFLTSLMTSSVEQDKSFLNTAATVAFVFSVVFALIWIEKHSKSKRFKKSKNL